MIGIDLRSTTATILISYQILFFGFSELFCTILLGGTIVLKVDFNCHTDILVLFENGWCEF